jgi:tetrahydromethanopterin S-methyltransferase subunit C
MFGAARPMEKLSKKTEPGSERFVLANGLTVILRPVKGTDSTALVVLYSIGNDHDPVVGLVGLGMATLATNLAARPTTSPTSGSAASPSVSGR